VLAELAKIAFADVRQVVKWGRFRPYVRFRVLQAQFGAYADTQSGMRIGV
jgi:hypothetical protein